MTQRVLDLSGNPQLDPGDRCGSEDDVAGESFVQSCYNLSKFPAIRTLDFRGTKKDDSPTFTVELELGRNTPDASKAYTDPTAVDEDGSLYYVGTSYLIPQRLIRANETVVSSGDVSDIRYTVNGAPSGEPLFPFSLFPFYPFSLLP